jgi:hypothetical protein
MNRLIATAMEQANQLGTGRAPFPDDNVFFIVRAQGARLTDAETLASTSTIEPRKHLKNNEKIVTEIVHPVRPASSPTSARRAGDSTATPPGTSSTT